MAAVRRPLLTLLALLLLLTVAVGVASSSADSSLNVSGTWRSVYHCRTGGCAGHDFPAGPFKLFQAAGSSTVTSDDGVSTGTLVGHTLNLHGGSSGGYSYTSTLTISADGRSWTGTLRDSNGTSGTDTGVRISKPRPTATTLRCTAVRPPGKTSTCSAVVAVTGAQASDDGSLPPPTGVVDFASADGSFGAGDGCTLAPLTSTSSACLTTFTPASLTGFPSLGGYYAGDDIDLGSNGSVDPLVDPPDDVSDCDHSVPTTLRLDSAAAKTPADQRGVTYCLYYGGAALFHAGLELAGDAVVGAVGTVAAVGSVGAGGTIGLAAPGVLKVPGGALGLYVGYKTATDYIIPAAADTIGAINQAQTKAIQEPPNAKYKTVAKPKRVHVPRLRLAHVNRRTTRAITGLARAQLTSAAVADALSLSLDRAGGAIQAGDNAAVGLQSRTIIAYSKRLAAQLDSLVRLQKMAAVGARAQPCPAQVVPEVRPAQPPSGRVAAQGSERAQRHQARRSLPGQQARAPARRQGDEPSHDPAQRRRRPRHARTAHLLPPGREGVPLLRHHARAGLQLQAPIVTPTAAQSGWRRSCEAIAQAGDPVLPLASRPPTEPKGQRFEFSRGALRFPLNADDQKSLKLARLSVAVAAAPGLPALQPPPPFASLRA